MVNERRRSQRVSVCLKVDLMLTGRSGETFAGPVNAELDTFSMHGGSVVLPSIKADGMHLFYSCSDLENCCLMLRFEDGSGQSHTISCRPAWFDKELDEVPAYYKMGFEFFRTRDRDNIRLLQGMAGGSSGKNLFRIIGDLFRRS